MKSETITLLHCPGNRSFAEILLHPRIQHRERQALDGCMHRNTLGLSDQSSPQFLTACVRPERSLWRGPDLFPAKSCPEKRDTFPDRDESCNGPSGCRDEPFPARQDEVKDRAEPQKWKLPACRHGPPIEARGLGCPIFRAAW